MGIAFTNFESFWHFPLSGQFGATDVFKISLPLQNELSEQLERRIISVF